MWRGGLAVAATLVAVAAGTGWSGRGAGEAQTATFAVAAVLPGVAVDAGALGCGATLPEGCPVATTTVTVRDEAGTGVVLTVEIADTPATRARGLMFRESLPELAGMLFVFPSETAGGFWMKDTPIPLDIAYLASDGEVLEIREGVPFNLMILSPAQPYRFTLEVNGGWFARHGLGVGDRVGLPEGLVGNRRAPSWARPGPPKRPQA